MVSNHKTICRYVLFCCADDRVVADHCGFNFILHVNDIYIREQDAVFDLAVDYFAVIPY